MTEALARVRHRPWLVTLIAAVAVVAALGIVAVYAGAPQADALAGCRIYVASGDDVTNGKEMDDDESRYPEKLLEEELGAPGWCVYNQGKDGQTSSSYISGGGLSQAYNQRPDLLTLQLGEQNATVVKLVDDCFEKVKKHDFSGANACAAAVLGNTSVWTSLKNNFISILQQTRIMASQRPKLVIAVVGYPNPYPSATTASTRIAQLCTPLIDNVLPCTVRWTQLPPALTLIDKAFQKLNSTLKESLTYYNAGPNGNRWVYVDTYTPMRDHCMKMDVTMRTTVEHPEQNGAVHQHDNFSAVSFGCDDPWFVEGSTGRDIPTYLDPSTPGVLVNKSQTTEGMGAFPDADGHACIAEAIWEADTIDPGRSPLKWKLGYGEAAETDICG